MGLQDKSRVLIVSIPVYTIARNGFVPLPDEAPRLADCFAELRAGKTAKTGLSP